VRGDASPPPDIDADELGALVGRGVFVGQRPGEHAAKRLAQIVEARAVVAHRRLLSTVAMAVLPVGEELAKSPLDVAAARLRRCRSPGPMLDAQAVNEPRRTGLAQRVAEDAGFDGERGRQAQSRVVSPRSVDSISSRVVA